MNKIITCENCDDCIYAGTGDFVCMTANPPVYIKKDWIPTKDYLKCQQKEFINNDI